MVRVLAICVLFLSGCTAGVDFAWRKPVDAEARQDIANIKSVLQQLAPIIDKSIDEKLAKERVKK